MLPPGYGTGGTLAGAGKMLKAAMYDSSPMHSQCPHSLHGPRDESVPSHMSWGCLSAMYSYFPGMGFDFGRGPSFFSFFFGDEIVPRT